MDVFLQMNDRKEGPFTVEQIVERVRSGQLSLATLSWRPGQNSWIALREIADIMDAVVPPVSSTGSNKTETANIDPVEEEMVRSFEEQRALSAIAGEQLLHEQQRLIGQLEAMRAMPPSELERASTSIKKADDRLSLINQELSNRSQRKEELQSGIGRLAVNCILVLVAILGLCAIQRLLSPAQWTDQGVRLWWILAFLGFGAVVMLFKRF